jgi:hypothetical protein
MKIRIADLRVVSNLLFDHLERSGHSEIELDKDYYWSISNEDLYDPFNEPKRIYLGQLYEDYESLKDLLSGRDEPVAFGLVWLSSLLRYIGEKIMF